MDQATQADITAAAAAHRELGRDYDDAVAESLIDRIGAEIDRRVDSRLSDRSSGARSPARPSQSGKSQTLVLAGAAAGAGVTGLVAILASNGESSATVKSVIWIWLILAVVGVSSVLVRKYRARG